MWGIYFLFFSASDSHSLQSISSGLGSSVDHC